MAQQNSSNFPIPATANVFQCIWKLTRTMKAAGWTYKASGDGTNKDTTGTAANDLWGGGANPLQDSYPTVANTTIAVASNGLILPQGTITVGSVAGFNPSGGTIYIGTINTVVTYAACSGTTFTGCTGGSGTLATGQTVKGLPALTDATVGWWVGSGPQTLKIGLNAVPTGTPVRGEIVTQATSGATGELIGYVWDTVGLTGWMVIGPQTGTFDAVHTLTGGISAATMVPLNTTIAVGSNTQTLPQAVINVANTIGFPAAGVALVTTGAGVQTVNYTSITGTTLAGCTGGTGSMSTGGAVDAAVVTFNREVMFAKTAASTVAGYIHYVCADPVSESTILLSFLAAQAGCTALIPPGCGGTANRFDTSSPVTGAPLIMCLRGTQIAAGQFTTADNWFAAATAFATNSQIGCANNIPASNVTADGSFFISLTMTTANEASGFTFQRVDDCEPGDCDPYVFFQTNSTNTVGAAPVFSRLTNTGVANAITYSYNLYGLNAIVTAGISTYFGYQSRGNTVIARDIPCAYFGILAGSTFVASPIQSMYPTTMLRAVCTPAASPQLIREPISLFAVGGGTTGNTRQSKGRCRWLMAYSAGSVLDTYDSKTWLAVTTYGVPAAQGPAYAVGPFDGTSTPLA